MTNDEYEALKFVVAMGGASYVTTTRVARGIAEAIQNKRVKHRKGFFTAAGSYQYVVTKKGYKDLAEYNNKS